MKIEPEIDNEQTLIFKLKTILKLKLSFLASCDVTFLL